MASVGHAWPPRFAQSRQHIFVRHLRKVPEVIADGVQRRRCLQADDFISFPADSLQRVPILQENADGASRGAMCATKAHDIAAFVQRFRGKEVSQASDQQVVVLKQSS